MKLSIVTTLYQSAATIDEFYRRAITAGEALTDDIEIILVNDGSLDGSLDRALAIHAIDPRVVVIDLARNAAHYKAMMVGLNFARGDLVFLIDSDLEEEPELLAKFYERMGAGDCDVVYGVQKQRRGGFLARLPGELYFALVGLLSDEKISRNLMTVRLMTRDYVRALVRHRDREFIIAQLWAASGFRQVAMPVRKLSLSKSTYTFRRRVEIAIKHVTTTSTTLLYLILYIGLFVSFWSAATVIYFVSRYVFFGIHTDGYTSLMVSIWFFGGLTTLILGILGVYIANLLSESKRRPYTVIRRIYRTGAPAQEASSNVIRTALGSSRVESGRTR
jgi:putative glycosyltransferase